MNTALIARQITVIYCLSLIAFIRFNTEAQESWNESYQSPPDALLRFQTDTEGRILPARVFGLETLRGGVFNHSETHFLMYGDSRAVYTDFISKTPLLNIETPSSTISSVAISPDDEVLLMGSTEGHFSAWFLRTGYRFLEHPGHNTRITATAFSPDGQAFATADEDGAFKVWNLESGPVPILSGEHGSRVRTIKFSSSGRLLLVGGQSYRVQIIDVDTGNRIQELADEASYIITAEISDDESEIFTAHRRNPTRRVWDLTTGKLKQELPTPYHSQNAYFDSAIDRLATVDSTGRVTIYSLSSGQQLDRQNFSHGNTSAFSLSPSGGFLYRQASFGEIYRREDDQRMMIFPNHLRYIESIAVSPDGSQIASSGRGLLATRIQDFQTGQVLNTIAGSPNRIQFSPDGEFVYDRQFGSKAHVESGAQFISSRRTIVATSIGPSRQLVLQSRQHSLIAVIDPIHDQPIAELEKSRGFENALYTFAPDQSLVASLSQRVIKIWATESGQIEREIRTDSSHYSIRFSPDSKSIITVDPDRGIAVWDPRDQWSGSWLEHSGSPISAIDVAPNGRSTVIGQADGTLSIIDLATGSSQAEMSGHDSVVTAVQFSPDGRWIVSGDSEGTIKTWPISPSTASPLRIARREGQSLRLASRDDHLQSQEITWIKDGAVYVGPEIQAGQLNFTRLEPKHAGVYQGKIDTPDGVAETMTLALTVLRPSGQPLSYEQWTSQFPWGKRPIAPNEDADNDLRSNLVEYLLGTHPIEFDSGAELLTIDRDSQGKLALRFRLAPHARDMEIHLESSSDLQTWASFDTEFSDTIQPDGRTQRSTFLPEDLSSRFFRWRAD